jgi:hypothetical protein
MLLPTAVLVLGLISVMFFELPRHLVARKAAAEEAAAAEPAPTGALLD